MGFGYYALGSSAELSAEDDLFAPSCGKVEDVAPFDPHSAALLKAECLRTELYMVVVPTPRTAILIFDGVVLTPTAFDEITESGYS